VVTLGSIAGLNLGIGKYTHCTADFRHAIVNAGFGLYLIIDDRNITVTTTSDLESTR